MLIDRLPEDRSVIFGRSRCDSCKKKIPLSDLVPLLSFVVLKGICRYCKSPIGWRTPIVELTTGLLFVLVFLYNSNNTPALHSAGVLTLLTQLIVVSGLIAIFFIDLKHGIIPDIIVFPTTVIAFLYLLLNTQYLIPNTLSGLGAFLFFLSLFLLTKGKGMGFGDVKLSFLLGIFLGFPKIVAGLYLSFLSGAVISLILITLRKKTLKQTVPFGPFLVAGTIAAFFLDDAIKVILPFLDIL